MQFGCAWIQVQKVSKESVVAACSMVSPDVTL
jgi:hypothetical protein